MFLTLTGRLPASGESVAVDIADGKITAIRPGPRDETWWISPGLIDLQVNGYAGWDINADDISTSTVISLAQALLNVGVTTFIPTIITGSQERIINTLRTIAQARQEDAMARHMIPYVHIEGPAISPEDGPRGAHPERYVRPPDLQEFARWQACSGNLVGLITLSPHFPESVDYIENVTRTGVQISIGHTHSHHEEIKLAVDAGARLSTHLGNGMHAHLARHPNYLWSQLAEDRLAAMFIADGHHLPSETLLSMLRAKGIGRSVLVSDTAALGGMPPGDYTSPIGGKVTLSETGRLSMSGTSFLAGAAKPLSCGVAYCAALPGISLSDALSMATVNAGHFVGGRGKMQVGECADLIRFSWDDENKDNFVIRETWGLGRRLK
ncbi:N-acetylglucosamine-6-phosphate deacetylase [Phytobacter sp. V91]|uniref:N-acetylglucosamine-6-phosphate deacetylase n=1 Tax=Phytobacter sp. V91 TaxID=3369425 RepID=UPI003F62D21C